MPDWKNTPAGGGHFEGDKARKLTFSPLFTKECLRENDYSIFGMMIEPKTLDQFSAAEIVGACLFEISWGGRSQTTIRAERRKYSTPSPLIFISHASEDKATVAKPLAFELEKLGHEVWLDEFELKVGDSLRARIADALTRSRSHSSQRE